MIVKLLTEHQLELLSLTGGCRGLCESTRQSATLLEISCLSLYEGQKYCRMLQESILQYFCLSFSYHVSLRPLFCLFLSGRLRQGLL